MLMQFTIWLQDLKDDSVVCPALSSSEQIKNRLLNGQIVGGSSVFVENRTDTNCFDTNCFWLMVESSCFRSLAGVGLGSLDTAPSELGIRCRWYAHRMKYMSILIRLLTGSEKAASSMTKWSGS